jgi:hypothetical protein
MIALMFSTATGRSIFEMILMLVLPYFASTARTCLTSSAMPDSIGQQMLVKTEFSALGYAAAL